MATAPTSASEASSPYSIPTKSSTASGSDSSFSFITDDNAEPTLDIPSGWRGAPQAPKGRLRAPQQGGLSVPQARAEDDASGRAQDRGRRGGGRPAGQLAGVVEIAE